MSGMEGILGKMQKLWNSVELRILVIISLLLQIVLIAVGNRRKYIKNEILKFIIWLCYLSADSVATLALGALSQTQGEAKNPSYRIMAFWAPFLLMHLGGPDTITAYALADNELWARHLLGLVGQVLVAIYVLLRSWSGERINLLWILVFVTGIVKYGERTLVLWSASRDRFRESMVSDPDPGPNYAKFMDEFVSREVEGYKVSHLVDISNITKNENQDDNIPSNTEEETPDDVKVLGEAYFFFKTFKRLFADLILSFQDKQDSLSFFQKQNWRMGFGIVEVELGLIYDLFYTKASILYSKKGFVLRFLSSAFTITAFIAFLIIIDKNIYPKTEVRITYFLLIGAVFLEMYALVMILSSDRTMISLTGEWMIKPSLSKLVDPIVLTIRNTVRVLQKLHIVPSRRRWSNAVGQYNFFNRCLEGEPKCPCIHPYVDKYLLKDPVEVKPELKELIFDELKLRSNYEGPEGSGTYRRDELFLIERDVFDKVEFDQSVLVWHMATDICCHTEEENASFEDKQMLKREMCVQLSDYMTYLLNMAPFMLPSGIGKIRFEDTRAEAEGFLQGQKGLSKREICAKLLEVDVRIRPSNVKGDRSKSLLFDACRLAKSLQVEENKWDIISRAWLDILTFAAAQCRWNNHAEKLSQGGELLTHVWLLMAHFGMTAQFQISKGYLRAKLQSK